MADLAISIIDCGAEADIARKMTAAETPDGSSSSTVLMFAIGSNVLTQQLGNFKISSDGRGQVVTHQNDNR